MANWTEARWPVGLGIGLALVVGWWLWLGEIAGRCASTAEIVRVRCP